MLDRMLRVDHAGEYGAVRIYEGQLAVLGGTSIRHVIREFMKQEEGHLRIMEDLVCKNKVKKTAMLPLWHAGAFLLGAGSALLGKEGAMACTVAVETVIGEHYDNQIRELLRKENGVELHRPLIEKISKIRDEELEHLDSGIEHDAEKAPLYRALTQVIKAGCWGAIWVSERV
jgi:ubiquinone biosynthesis monooxygenase Coq7